MKEKEKVELVRLYNRLSWFMCFGGKRDLNIEISSSTTLKELEDAISVLYDEDEAIKNQPEVKIVTRKPSVLREEPLKVERPKEEPKPEKVKGKRGRPRKESLKEEK